MGMIHGRVVEVDINNHKITLEQIVDNMYVIPIGLLKGSTDTLSQTVIDGIEFLKSKGGGELVVPPTSTEDEVRIKVYRNKETHQLEDIFIVRYWRPPILEEYRPYTNGPWKPGDVVKGVMHSGIITYAWICHREGAPGEWTEIGTVQSISKMVDEHIELYLDPTIKKLSDGFRENIVQVMGDVLSNYPIKLEEASLFPIQDGDSLGYALGKLNNLLKQLVDGYYLGNSYLGNAYLRQQPEEIKAPEEAYLGNSYLGDAYCSSSMPKNEDKRAWVGGSYLGDAYIGDNAGSVDTDEEGNLVKILALSDYREGADLYAKIDGVTKSVDNVTKTGLDGDIYRVKIN